MRCSKESSHFSREQGRRVTVTSYMGMISSWILWFPYWGEFSYLAMRPSHQRGIKTTKGYERSCMKILWCRQCKMNINPGNNKNVRMPMQPGNSRHAASYQFLKVYLSISKKWWYFIKYSLPSQKVCTRHAVLCEIYLPPMVINLHLSFQL